MRERGYDQLTPHKNDHERLLDELRDMMEDFEAGVQIDDKRLAQSLDAWFRDVSRPTMRGCTRCWEITDKKFQ